MEIEIIKASYLKGEKQRYSETKNQEIFNFIEELPHLEHIKSHKEKVYCYINSLVPKCKEESCTSGKIPKFENFTKGFKDYCSISCGSKASSKQANKTIELNIEKLAEGLTPKEIVQKLYTKELKIQKYRSIKALEPYQNFKNLEELYNHLVLGEVKEKKLFNIEIELNEVLNTKNTKDFIIKGQKYNMHYKYHTFNEVFFKELYSRIEKKTDNHIENMYCFVHNIEPKDKGFINFKLGYKKEIVLINYSKEPLEILEQFKEKYGEYINYSKNLDYMYWVNHFEGVTLKDCFNNISKGYIKEFSFNDKLDRDYINSMLLSKKDLIKLDSGKYKCLKCDNVFEKTTVSNPICRVCTPKIAGFSLQEKEVFDYIKTIYDGEILENTRHLGFEMDIFIPELDIGIEYNGTYWHSARFKTKDYHLKKTEKAEALNIHLIHIFSTEWLNKKEIVESIIKAKLNKISTKIYARKCKIKEITAQESNQFLDKNHIQGSDNAKYRYGLFNNGNLVQVLTLKRSHRSKDKYLELKRSASLLCTSVVGGFSRLLKFAKEKHKEDIITFADRRYSYKENVYSKIGTLIDTIPMNYFYEVDEVLKSREQFQKHKLKDILDVFDENLTAHENCHMNDLYEIYDCGNFKYLL